MKKIGLLTQVYTFIPPKSVHFYTAVDTDPSVEHFQHVVPRQGV